MHERAYFVLVFYYTDYVEKNQHKNLTSSPYFAFWNLIQNNVSIKGRIRNTGERETEGYTRNSSSSHVRRDLHSPVGCCILPFMLCFPRENNMQCNVLRKEETCAKNQ